MGTDKMILLVFIFNGLLFQGVVAGGLQQNREDAERIAHMFAHIDADGNGLIDIGEFKGHEVAYVYLEESGQQWDWDLLSRVNIGSKVLDELVQHSVREHEAYKYRPARPELLRYEHVAMVADMVVRLTRAAPQLKVTFSP